MVKKDPIKVLYLGDSIMTEASDDAMDLFNSNRFGAKKRDQVQLSGLEALYLLDKDKIIVFDGKNKTLTFEDFLKRVRRKDKNFWTRFVVFRDLRDRGYIVKTALKFGADFRVYDRGVKPGEGHAKWVVFAVHESEGMTWHGFSAKNRVAHSTKKKLMIGIVDDEGDVTYYEVKWIKP